MYKIITTFTDEEKEKLEYICKVDKRKKNNMLAFLVDYYYKKTQKKENENQGFIKGKRKKGDDLYQKAIEFMNSGVEWEGNIDEWREDRNIDIQD